MNPDGSKKGDALVTYSRAEAAAMAVIQVILEVEIYKDSEQCYSFENQF